MKEDKSKSPSSVGKAPSSRSRSASDLIRLGPGADPVPPDSGWAWVVLFGNFIVTMNSLGYVTALGVFFLSWKSEFESTAAATSVVISIGSFMRGLVSPIVGVLFTKFSARSVMIAGGIISSTGILLTSFGTSIAYLIGTTGVLAAIGFSCAFNANYVMLRTYFKKRYSLAVGLNQAGVSAGQLVLPPLYTWLINEYGWRGALFIISAINLNIVAMAALMRPVRAKRVSRKDKRPDRRIDQAVTAVGASSDPVVPSEAEHSPEETHVEAQTERADDVRNEAPAASDELPTLDADPTLDTVVLVAEDANSDAEEMDEDWPDLERDYPVLHGNPANPFMFTIGAEDRISRVSALVTNIRPGSFLGYVKLYCRVTKAFLLDTYGLRRLSHNLSFAVVCLVAFCMAYGWASMSVHLVPRAEFVGVESEVSSLFISIMGAVGLFCRPFVGWVVDKHIIRPELLYSAAMALLSLAVFMVPLFDTFGPLAADAVLLGLGAGVSGSLVMVMLHNAVRPSEAAAATGILFLCWGVGEIIGGTISGFLFDATEIYDYSFYGSGAVTLVAGILALVTFFLLKAQRRRQGAKATAAVSMENPGFVGDLDQSAGSNDWRHEAVNPMYTVEEGEAGSRTERAPTDAVEEPSSPRKFNLPSKTNLISKWGPKQDYRLEMSHITAMRTEGTPDEMTDFGGGGRTLGRLEEEIEPSEGSAEDSVIDAGAAEKNDRTEGEYVAQGSLDDDGSQGVFGGGGRTLGRLEEENEPSGGSAEDSVIDAGAAEKNDPTEGEDVEKDETAKTVSGQGDCEESTADAVGTGSGQGEKNKNKTAETEIGHADGKKALENPAFSEDSGSDFASAERRLDDLIQYFDEEAARHDEIPDV